MIVVVFVVAALFACNAINACAASHSFRISLSLSFSHFTVMYSRQMTLENLSHFFVGFAFCCFSSLFFRYLLRVFAVICFTFVIVVVVVVVVGIAFVHWAARGGLRLATSASTRSPIVNCFLFYMCEGFGQSRAGQRV